MTEHEQALADDKMRAEITRLIAETGKLIAETNQIKMSTLLAPTLAAAALLGAGGAIVKLLF